MCTETITSYRYCMLQTTHTVVCLRHIAHTLKQEDNKPCPELKKVVINSDSGRCFCRDGGACKRKGYWGEVGTWAFEREKAREKRVESMEQRGARLVKEIWHQLQLKKNELSWLRQTAAGEGGKVKRRKKNEVPDQEERRASFGGYDRSDTPVTDDDEGMGQESPTTMTLYNPVSAEQSRKIRELEKEIGQLYQDWSRRSGIPMSKASPDIKASRDMKSKSKNDTYDSYRPAPGDYYKPSTPSGEGQKKIKSDSYRPIYEVDTTSMHDTPDEFEDDTRAPNPYGVYESKARIFSANKSGSPVLNEANSRQKRTSKVKKQDVERAFGGPRADDMWSGKDAVDDDGKGVWEDVKGEEDVEME